MIRLTGGTVQEAAWKIEVVENVENSDREAEFLRFAGHSYS